MDLPRTAAVAARLDVVDQSPSTNAQLRASADGAPHLTVLLTDHQTAGRGRLDRTWVTPPGSALAISVLLRELPAAPASRGWIPLVAGLAMADAVAAQLPEHEVGVKWPNDVLVDGRKICGILAEATPDAVIVGSGVNTAMTTAQLPVETATSFAALGAVADADRLVADYVTGLDAWIAALAAEPASARVHDAVAARCLTIGQQVRVELPAGGELRGVATRLDADGRLVVEADGAEHPVSAGDVVHVRPI
ncbi:MULTISPECIES: biotin--[acetyl-CoA-carboxylase] ligase [unclassified Microbacterium]|uniref:biotin--[acetyl-CoA-carboxylase] ligase n=1 Tax=unclassified Microbacterium TaxID=2609290 RepID=UPI0012F9B704|nr:biotin--[acetyl-CoA-carboxylase] ligase [Microbacterium sp. MAH-37]MVQ41849.1 biotin--[acetyl-CoA-carboxylase] ligase [Microbacterium sp. MAH-37]